MDLSDDIKAYVEKKVSKAETFLNHIIDAHVILGAEKHRRIAEVTINAKHATFHASEVTEDIYSAIDGVMEKIRTQVKRYKEKLKDKKHRDRASMPEEEVEGSDVDEDIDEEDVDTEAEETPVVIKVKKFAPKPMTPEEAAIYLEMSDDEFLMFSNSTTGQVNVVFKRKDNTYGLIEPDFD